MKVSTDEVTDSPVVAKEEAGNMDEVDGAKVLEETQVR